MYIPIYSMHIQQNKFENLQKKIRQTRQGFYTLMTGGLVLMVVETGLHAFNYAVIVGGSLVLSSMILYKANQKFVKQAKMEGI